MPAAGPAVSTGEAVRIEVELVSPITAWLGERRLALEMPAALTVAELLQAVMQSREHYEKEMRAHGLYDGRDFHLLCMLEQKIVSHQHVLEADCRIKLLSPLLGG